MNLPPDHVPKPRLTDAEFDELKRRRDEAVAKVVAEVCKKFGGDPKDAHIHMSHAGPCYCACPDGPCQHIWDGPDYMDDNCVCVTCSRCGTPAIYHDIRFGP